MLAFDKGSARTYDKDGRLHIDRSHITKASVNGYLGKEIPGAAALGLDLNKMYQLLRDPAELEKAAPKFARLPILSKHLPINTKIFPPELIVGTIGSDVAFSAPYLDADLCFWTAAAIAGVETDTVRELSCAYGYVPVMMAGEYEGKAYDGIMTEIEPNHLAVVEAGRAGHDVLAADSKLETTNMKFTKLGKALFVSLGAVSPKLAQDAALPTLVGMAEKKTFKKDDVVKKIIAMDSDMDSDQMGNIIDAVMDVEQTPEPVIVPPVVKDADPAVPTDKKAKLQQMLSGKVDDDLLAQILGVACDDKPEEKETPDMKPAMDELRRSLNEAAAAREAVRPVVGKYLAMDSATQIYEFALDEMKVPHVNVTELAGLQALFAQANVKTATAVSTPRVAMDAKGAEEMFPGANRFKQA